MTELATITIDIDPTIELGPLELAWHGIMIAVGIAVGAWAGMRYARERGLDPETLLNAVLVLAVAGIVGARLFFLAVDDPVALVQPGEWLGTQGFAFYGAIIVGTAATALYLRRAGMGPRYLDAMAAGFPLGMAVGRDTDPGVLGINEAQLVSLALVAAAAIGALWAARRFDLSKGDRAAADRRRPAARAGR